MNDLEVLHICKKSPACRSAAPAGGHTPKHRLLLRKMCKWRIAQFMHKYLKGSKAMLKKSLAWVLTLAMVISALSGLALITSADETPFALASFISGQPLYKNAGAENLDNISDKGAATKMESITGNPKDRYAHFMTTQNAQLGLSIPAGSGIGSNATIEIKFWASDKNVSNTRMGIQISTGSHNQENGSASDYSWIKMSGAPSTETVAVDAEKIGDAIEDYTVVMAADDSEELTEEGWKILRLKLNDANFDSAGRVNIVNWSSTNGDDTKEGWYIQSILVYDTTAGRPSEAEVGIREDVIGYYDFVTGPDDDTVLGVDGGTQVTVEDMPAQKLTKADGYKLTVESLATVDQPAVLKDDKKVTLMAEVKEGDDGEWKVLRADITNEGAVSFDFGEKLFAANVTADTIYVRKVVLAQTKLITKNTFDTAFVDLDNPYSDYNEFQRIAKNHYNATTGFEGEGAVEEVNGKTAALAKADNVYYWINLDDTFTVHGATPIADYRIDVTYLDKGTGDLNLQYNKALAEGEEDSIEKQFASTKIATLTDSGNWMTASIYLSDAHFRNAANGADFRLALSKDQAISAVTVTVGADKSELSKWAGRALNEFAWTPESVVDFKAAQTAASATLTNKYATAAEVAAKLTDILDAYKALEAATDVETRFELTNAVWVNASKDGEGNIIASTSNNATNGDVVKEDGWYCWKFTPETTATFIGLAPEDPDFFKDSTSVTYEYDIKFDTTETNDRAFIGFGSKTYGWTSVNDKTNQENFNGIQAGGSWISSPTIGKWGKVQLTNADFDNNATDTERGLTGAITTMGSWMEHGTMFIRNIKVYDTEHPEKFIELAFKEDVAELVVTPSEGMTLATNNDYESYTLDSADKSLKIATKDPINDGIVTKGENNVLVAIDYYLEKSDNANEKLTLTYGDGKTAEITHDQLTFRENWVRTSFKLTDANFGSVENLELKYTDGSKIYIRGIRLYAYKLDEAGNEVMTSEKATKWGQALLTQDAIDHAYVDWSNKDAERSYGLTYKFDEGENATVDQEEGDRNTKLMQDDKLYVSVDRSVVKESDRYVRIDITHEEGTSLYVQYNYALPEGVDDSEDPNLNLYRFHVSGENKEVKDVTDENGDTVKRYEWITDEADFVNMLGVIKSTTDDTSLIVWKTTSIYLKDAQFRGAANGYDFRIMSTNSKTAAISGLEVRAITEEEYNAAQAKLGDMTALKAAIAEAKAQQGESEAVKKAEYFVEYNYRATQAEIDAALEALKNGAKLGDVNNDGSIDTADAVLVLQCAAKLIKDEDLNKAAADVNGDGTIDTADAVLILQHAAKLISKFPAEG